MLLRRSHGRYEREIATDTLLIPRDLFAQVGRSRRTSAPALVRRTSAPPHRRLAAYPARDPVCAADVYARCLPQLVHPLEQSLSVYVDAKFEHSMAHMQLACAGRLAGWPALAACSAGTVRVLRRALQGVLHGYYAYGHAAGSKLKSSPGRRRQSCAARYSLTRRGATGG